MYQFHYFVKQTQQMFQLPCGKEKLGCKQIPLAGQLIRSPELISTELDARSSSWQKTNKQ